MDTMQSKYLTHTAVFTDRSTEPGCSSVVFIIPEDSVSHGYRLLHRTLSTTVELYGIFLLLTNVVHKFPRDWVVYSDSKTALQCRRNMGIHESLASVITDIFQAIKRREADGHYVVLQWVSAHCGIHDNEQADRSVAAAHQS